MTAERFMALRVSVTDCAVVAGFAVADGPRRILLAGVFGIAAVYLPGFLLKKAARSGPT